MTILNSLLTSPAFADQEKNRVAKMLYTMLLILWISTAIAFFSGIIFDRTLVITNTAVLWIIISACLALTRVGYVNEAALATCLALILSMTAIAYLGNGIYGRTLLTFPFILVIGSLILAEHLFILITILSLLAAGFLTAADMSGLIGSPMSAEVSIYDFLSVAFLFVVTAVFTRYFANSVKQNLRLAQQNEQSLLLLNQQLAQSEEETSQFLQNLQSLYEINLELSRLDSLPALYKRAVELGRAKLGFDRLAVLLYDPQSGEMMGTYGTNEQGETVDESYFRGPPFPYMLKMINERPRVFIRQDEPLHFAGEEVGTGWNALTILWDGDKGVGWLTTDNLVRQEAIIPYRLEILSLYGSTIGHLITLKRHEEMVNTYARSLEVSNQELEQFASTASHDLQEPLRKIQIFGERLATNYSAAIDERGQDYIARMQDAATRMQRLIEDLLSLSRLSTQAQPFTPVDLDAILKEVLQDLETRIEETEAAIRTDPLPAIEADPTQMRQLLQNLLSNALKFTRPDTPPEVDVSYAESFVDGRKCAVITVQDNGIGFDEQYSGRIFTAFQRLHTRDEYEGTGIGLALCARIVDRHNGRITAHSTPGEGATFTVILPIKQG